MRDELYIINPPTSSYDNPISLDSLKYMKDKLLGALENPEILDKLGAVALGLYDTALENRCLICQSKKLK